jgi:hypothetical protein
MASHLKNHVVLFCILPLGSTKMGRKMGHIHLTAAHTQRSFLVVSFWQCRHCYRIVINQVTRLAGLFDTRLEDIRPFS